MIVFFEAPCVIEGNRGFQGHEDPLRQAWTGFFHSMAGFIKRMTLRSREQFKTISELDSAEAAATVLTDTVARLHFHSHEHPAGTAKDIFRFDGWRFAA